MFSSNFEGHFEQHRVILQKRSGPKSQWKCEKNSSPFYSGDEKLRICHCLLRKGMNNCGHGICCQNVKKKKRSYILC